MKKLTISFLLLLFGMFVGVSAQSRNKRYEEYIHKYKDMAMEQMARYKIPASITLAQGLLESGAGQSDLTKYYHNHFGIKCGSNWNGKTTYHDDDAQGECFRVYKNARESYEDHSRFLANRPRYASLFKLKQTDYKGWAHGLKSAGYATNPNYATSLIRIVELYELHQYDGTSKKYKSVVPIVAHETYLSNKLLYIIVRQGDTFKNLSEEFEISERKLLKYNDLYKGYRLKEGDVIYLQKKNRKANKAYILHKVESGESMHSISQRYGMQLKYLYKLNGKTVDYSPSKGDYLRLR